MTLNARTLRDLRNPIGSLILLAALAAAAGCSTAETPGGSNTNMNHVLPSGSSVSGWLVVPSGGTHASTATLDYIASGGSSGCAECHGSDLSGGMSKVSCFGYPAGCHHDPVSNWTTPAGHGKTAKKAPGSSGFASCQICHGSDFSGGGSGITCSSCHGIQAPHPANWLPANNTARNHTDTDGENATVCAACHAAGANSPLPPPFKPPAGTPAGCFNSTLCHGPTEAPHPMGSTWVATSPAAQPHGASAKAAPGSTSGFSYCQVCHGSDTNFSGGTSQRSCYPCHGVNAPHPRGSTWRGSGGYTHRTTNQGNAAVCAYCHRNANPGTPGCFNNTLCHGAAGAPHPVGSTWVATSPAAQPHGASAKAAPGSTAGFAYCQVCHGSGTNFSGGSAGISCYPCHGVSAPHPRGSTWRGSGGYTHRTTNQGNAAVCAYCHRFNPGTAGCFNDTLCHGN